MNGLTQEEKKDGGKQAAVRVVMVEGHQIGLSCMFMIAKSRREG